MTICIDFDGVFVQNIYPYIGEAVDGAVEVVKKLEKKGHTLILLTMREGHLLDEAEEWLRNNGIEMKYLNCNPEYETGSRKVYGNLYIDDHGLGIPLCAAKSSKPYVDWIGVELMLERNGIL